MKLVFGVWLGILVRRRPVVDLKQTKEQAHLLEAFIAWKTEHVEEKPGHCVLYSEFQDCYYHSVDPDSHLTKASLSQLLRGYGIYRFRLTTGGYGVRDIALKKWNIVSNRFSPILVEDSSALSSSSDSSDDIGSSDGEGDPDDADDDYQNEEGKKKVEPDIRYQSWIKSPKLARIKLRCIRPRRGRPSSSRCPDLAVSKRSKTVTGVSEEMKDKWYNHWGPLAKEVEEAGKENRPLRQGSCRLEDLVIKEIPGDDRRLNLRGQKGVFLKWDARPLEKDEMIGPYRSYVKECREPIPACTTEQHWQRYRFQTDAPKLDFSAFDDAHGNITRYINDFRINPPNTSDSETKNGANVAFCTCLYRGFPQVLIQVIAPVAPGEEILLDYGDLYFINNDWKEPLPTPSSPSSAPSPLPTPSTPSSSMLALLSVIAPPPPPAPVSPAPKQDKPKKKIKIKKKQTPKRLINPPSENDSLPKLIAPPSDHDSFRKLIAPTANPIAEPVRIAAHLISSTLIR